MKILFAAALCLAMTAPVLADDKVYVQLPDLSDYWKPGGMDLLYQLARAELAIDKCPGYNISPAETSLLTDSIAMLWHMHDVDEAEYAQDYTGIALAQLDCAVDGPDIAKAVDALVELGGSREPLPDQAQAAEDYEAMRAGWEAN